ncbi:MAG: DUF1007 family protein [Bacteriovoracaceae bacterium]|nr:DUF1007 family protein [Bacteriovoracaceae bacterium]
MKLNIFLLSFLCISSSFAHPHIFIDVNSKLVKVDNKKIQIDVEWLFDGMTSESLIGDFDANMNQKIDPSEQKLLVKSFKDNISKYNYMTEIQLGSNKEKIKFNVSNQSFATKAIVFDGAKMTGLLYRYSIIAKNSNIGDKLRVRIVFYDPSSYSELAPAAKISIPKSIKTLNSKLIKIKSMQDFTVGL